jgi:hypothetical protein
MNVLEKQSWQWSIKSMWTCVHVRYSSMSSKKIRAYCSGNWHARC